jgi:hypothetical protein
MATRGVVSKKMTVKAGKGDPRVQGRVCGVCVAGLVSGIASGKIALAKRKRYRAAFDRPKHLSPAGYEALVLLEGRGLTMAEIETAMRRWKVAAQIYERSSGELLKNVSVAKNGRLVVDVDWEAVRASSRRPSGRAGGRAEDRAMAETILEQLGGRKFIAMTGARDFLYSKEGTLQFKLPKSARARGGITAVIVTLYPDDTYGMVFFAGMQAKADRLGLHAEDLRRAFTEVTGLETSLGTMGRAVGRAGRRGRAGGDGVEPKQWGVFPWTPDTTPPNKPVPNPKQGGWVVREVNAKTGRGAHWPYSQIDPVRVFYRRHLADQLSTSMTYGKGSTK